MQAGATVGAYQIVRQLGEGGMGVVWLAEHTLLGRRAAIKVLHRSFSDRQDVVTRFFNEAKAATAIADPGIVQIFDFGHSDGSAYIVMELLEGEGLQARLNRMGRVPVGEALRIMRQVAGSVGAAHVRGVVHRDLKPDNIYLVRDPEVPGGERAKILDFGIAKLAADQNVAKTHTHAVMGTPAYMSPEQCRGAGFVDQRSDVYSLGCVLFHLVVGVPPFSGQGVGDLIAQHLREPAPAPSSLVHGVVKPVEDLILRCLEKDASKRFANGSALASAIAVLLADPPIANAAATFSASADTAPTVPASIAGDLTPPNPVASGTDVPVPTSERANAAAAPSAAGTQPPHRAIASGATQSRRRKIIVTALAGGLLTGIAAVWMLSRGPSDPVDVSPNLTPIATAPPAREAPVEPPPSKASVAVPINLVKYGFYSIKADATTSVQIDGVSLGPMPLVRVPLKPGGHVVQLLGPNGKSKKLDITIVGGQDTDDGTIKWNERSAVRPTTRVKPSSTVVTDKATAPVSTTTTAEPPPKPVELPATKPVDPPLRDANGIPIKRRSGH